MLYQEEKIYDFLIDVLNLPPVISKIIVSYYDYFDGICR